MKRRTPPVTVTVLTTILSTVGCWLAFTPAARADEDDDLQRQIDTQKAGVPDLEHLDTRRAAAGEIQHLKDWLNVAWELRSKHEPDQAREVLDRCLSQAELVRQVIAADDLKAKVSAREDKLTRTRDEIAKKRKALQDAQVKKKALEPAVGS
jgi:hypothetical protein